MHGSSSRWLFRRTGRLRGQMVGCPIPHDRIFLQGCALYRSGFKGEGGRAAGGRNRGSQEGGSRAAELEEKRLEEEGKRIDEVKASLSAEELDAISQEASQLIEQEHGLVRFGRETLIQLKVRDRIRARYLKPDSS